MGPICCTETSVRNCHYSRPNNARAQYSSTSQRKPEITCNVHCNVVMLHQVVTLILCLMFVLLILCYGLVYLLVLCEQIRMFKDERMCCPYSYLCVYTHTYYVSETRVVYAQRVLIYTYVYTHIRMFRNTCSVRTNSPYSYLRAYTYVLCSETHAVYVQTVLIHTYVHTHTYYVQKHVQCTYICTNIQYTAAQGLCSLIRTT